jgi:hypothetical protein
MTPEAEYLLASLRHGAAELPCHIDWDTLFLLADTHGVLPLFYRSYRGTLPGNFVERMREQWASTLYLTNELNRILDRFEEQTIQVIPLKGPVLAQMLYGEVRLRPCTDLDLLVRPQAYERAESALRSMGFQSVTEIDNYHQTFERAGVFVELHFATASPATPYFDLGRAWERSEFADFRGRAVRSLSRSDLILYLALHGLKHRFARLIWAVDLSRVFAKLSDRDFSALLDRAQAERLGNVLLAAYQVTQEAFRFEPFKTAIAALAEKPNISTYATAVVQEMFNKPADPATSVHAIDWCLQVEDSPLQRWKQRFRVLLPSRQDYEWAARYGIHRVWVPVIRPFRLLAKYPAGSALRYLFPLR